MKSWLEKGDLSTAFSLSPISTLEVPIFVNILAVGLDGSGSLGIKLETEDLEDWMEHLDHIIPHNVIRSEQTEGEGEEMEHTSSTKRQQAAKAHTRKRVTPDEPDTSMDAAKIQYRYHIRLIHLSPKVIDVVERYLSIHYRVENKDHTVFQIDAEIMNAVLDALAHHLEIEESTPQQRITKKHR